MHLISNQHLTIDRLFSLVNSDEKLALSDESRAQIDHCREYLDRKLENSDTPIYGINTGFGSLHSVKINASDLRDLQANLVMSHACGMGDVLDIQFVKAILLLKIQSLSYGFSGVRSKVVDALIELYNHDLFPVIYEQGSLGASGDLAPLAHLSLPLLGLGEIWHNGEKLAVAENLDKLPFAPFHLEAKEGLALLNGTQFMTGIGSILLARSKQLLKAANSIATLSVEAFHGNISPFLPQSHLIRKQPGQRLVAAEVLASLLESELLKNAPKSVQDPYSFRCIPQVHGASLDTLGYASTVLENEMNSVTDNPNVFPDDDMVISAGNFHGQPLALAMDFAIMAIAELANISERRVYLLISGQRGLPNYLITKPGLHSGMMIPQYTAASIVSQNKQLSSPSCVDSIPSSNGQEDHVSMGANSATRMIKVVGNLQKVLGIELLNASQAAEFRNAKDLSPKSSDLYRQFRKEVPFISDDKVMFTEMQKAYQFVDQYFVA